jgi:peptidoglycan hydrolase CwlO-like protein
MKKIFTITVAMLFITSLFLTVAGCKKSDEAINKVKDATKEAANKVQEAAKEAKSNMTRPIKDIKENVSAVNDSTKKATTELEKAEGDSKEAKE